MVPPSSDCSYSTLSRTSILLFTPRLIYPLYGRLATSLFVPSKGLSPLRIISTAQGGETDISSRRSHPSIHDLRTSSARHTYTTTPRFIISGQYQQAQHFFLYTQPRKLSNPQGPSSFRYFSALCVYLPTTVTNCPYAPLSLSLALVSRLLSSLVIRNIL